MYYKIFCPLTEYNIHLYMDFFRHCLQDGYIHDSYLQDGYIHKQLPKTVNYKTHYTGRFLLVLHLLSPRIPYVISILLLSPRVPACSISNSIYRKRLYKMQIQSGPLIWLKLFKNLPLVNLGETHIKFKNIK